MQAKANIKKILLEKRVAALEALNRYYAALAINYFSAEQRTGIDTSGRWWDNKTTQAAARIFTGSIKDGNSLGWFIAHGIDYGVYLTLANDRRNDALTPIIRRFAGRYFNDVKKIFGG
jgi:hypothetical protein